LREKQKLKRMYGVLEKQFRKYFVEAERRQGNTGETLIQLLESRLDNVVYRMGFGSTRAEARQLVAHRAIEMNGRTADVPSMMVKAGDVVTIREKAKKQLRIKESIDLATGMGLPQWVQVDTTALSGVFKQVPDRADVARDINESMVVELYSR
jgi:small subunit ribosomal protein S4